MRLNEFHKTLSAKQINENIASMFGEKINLESFTLEQLEDARNKLRTKLSQFENSSNYNAVYEDEEYGKNKMFLDVLNKAIEERLTDDIIEFSSMEQMVLDKVSEGSINFKELPEELKKKCKEAAGKSSDQIDEKAPEGWEGTVKAMKKHGDEIDNPWALAHWMKNKGYKSHKKESIGEGVIKEGEEEKAELIMAARDMVDRITSWMEDTANMQAESMLELIDSIRDELGSDVSMEFESVVKPALAAIYTALESSRTQLTSSVALLTGEGGAEMMGADPMASDDMGVDADLGLDADMDAGMDAEDEFAADQAAAGGEEAVGRATRESIEHSRQLAKILVQKKNK